MKRGKISLKFILGISIVSLIILTAIFAPLLAPYNPLSISLENELKSPNRLHLLGTDSNGADILSALIYGARVSMEIGFIVTVFSLSIGLILGSIAGYYGGWRDVFLMRLLDIIFAFPGIILAIAMASMLGPSKMNLILCLVATSWAGYARLVRGEVMTIKHQEYVEAARALGLPTWRIFLFHLWPNILSILLASATFGIAGTILAEASLSFLGIGMPPTIPSWGSLLNFGRDVLIEAPHVTAFPGIMIMITVLGFHFLGEGLRQQLDPKADR